MTELQNIPSPISLSLIFALLRDGRRVIFTSSVVAVILASLLAFYLPSSFTAASSFIPPGSSSDVSAAALMGQPSAFAGAGLGASNRNLGDLDVAILKSRTVAREMIHNFDLERVYEVKNESDTERMLASRSFFLVDGKDPVVRIFVTDFDPQRAHDLAVGYLREVQKISVSLAQTASSQHRLFYEQRLDHERHELANAEMSLEKVEERTGFVSPAAQTESNLDSLSQLQQQIALDQSKLAALLRDETDENPSVIRFRDAIASLQNKVAELESGRSKDFGRISTAQVPEAELEYIRNAREVKYHEALLDILTKQYEGARLNELQDSPLQILDNPTVPDVPSAPPRKRIILAGLLLGLFSSSAFVLFRAFWLADSKSS